MLRVNSEGELELWAKDINIKLGEDELLDIMDVMAARVCGSAVGDLESEIEALRDRVSELESSFEDSGVHPDRFENYFFDNRE